MSKDVFEDCEMQAQEARRMAGKSRSKGEKSAWLQIAGHWRRLGRSYLDESIKQVRQTSASRST